MRKQLGALAGTGAILLAASVCVAATRAAAGPVTVLGSTGQTEIVNCPGLGSLDVALPSGTPTSPVPAGVSVSVGFTATDSRTGAAVAGGHTTGAITCASVPFTNLTIAAVASGSAPPDVAPSDRLTGRWLISVSVNVNTDSPAVESPSAAAQPQAPFVSGIQSYLATRGGSVSAAVFDATDGITYRIAPQTSYVTASIVKVDILATLLRNAQVAGRGLTAQERATATQMIEFSDNNAATALWNEDGGSSGVASFNRLIPLPSTFPGSGGLWGLTRTTAADQVALVRQVAYSNSILGPSQRAYEQGLMENVTPSQRWGVSGGVPSGVTVALKNGWLPVSGGWEINSIGHIFGGGKDYVIAVLTSGDPTMGYGITTIQGVSSIVWSQLPSSPASGATTGPSETVASSGVRYVFYKGGDGGLWQLIWNGSAWSGPYDLGMGPLGSEPSADIDASGRTFVFWMGGDGNLWEGFWTGSGWSGARLVGMGPLGSRPSATVAANGTQYVFWKGSDGNLIQAIGNSGQAWSGPYDLGMGPLGSEPSADIDASGRTSVFWMGGDGNLWEGFWTGTGWSGARLVGTGPLGSRPSAAVAANGTQYVFWKGSDGNLIQAIGNSGQAWSGPYDLGMGPLGSEPSAGIDGNGNTSVVWKGADGYLWQGYWTGTAWSGAIGVGVRLS